MTRRGLLHRRTVLRGAGGIAISLPLLDAMIGSGQAHAQVLSPTRFVVFYTPGGTEMSSWRPTGTETSFTLPFILAPLETLKQRLLIVDGLNMSVTNTGPGHQHAKGMGGLLTGRPLQNGNFDQGGIRAGFASGISVDQVIAQKIKGTTRFPSLEVGVQSETFQKYYGVTLSPANNLNLSGAGQPLPVMYDPRAVLTRVFSDSGTTTPDQAAQLLRYKRNKSILDGVIQEYAALKAKVGSEDRAKLEAHLTQIREAEVALGPPPVEGTLTCPPPTINAPTNFKADVNIPATGKAQMDLLVASLACDQTRVATMQWVDSEADNVFPWLSAVSGSHHENQHNDSGGAYNKSGIEQINRWYAEQFAYLLQKMISVKEGDKTLLDRTVVFWCTELAHPSSHSHTGMPFVLAGSAGGRLRTGRWVRYSGRPHNDLLVTLQNAFDLGVQTFGMPEYCTGPLPNLT
jgi:hypothetical protein